VDVPARLRDVIERRSVLALTYLNSLPRPVTSGAFLLLLLVGVFTSGMVGAVALGLIAVFMAWLMYVGWPQMSPLARALRLLVTVAVAVLAVRQLR
jgi:hypothetical protein